MTPIQSRQIARFIQDFSPSEKADFYYFTMVQNKDPIAYLQEIGKTPFTDLVY